MNAQSMRTKNSSSDLVLPDKGQSSLDDMPPVLDHRLSTGSILRCVCPKCKNPRVVSIRNCHSCGNELVIWLKDGTSNWTQPRKAPKDVSGPYQQCKHFLQRKHCAKTPCTFAHGRDELEIWELCRKESKLCSVKLYWNDKTVRVLNELCPIDHLKRALHRCYDYIYL